MPNVPDAVFVVMADLHFGDDLLLEANGPLQGVPWWLGIFDADIKRFFDKRCVAHDVSILKSLPRYLKQLLLIERGAGFGGENFDLYLLLGDQVTQPTESSYRFLREYLTSHLYQTGDSELQHSCAGLNIPLDRLVAIPGNHDKLLLPDLNFYQEEFPKLLGLPAGPNKQSVSTQLRLIGKRKFLFLLADASKYASVRGRVDFSCREHLAAGEISPGLRSEIVGKVEMLKGGRSVDGIHAGDYDSATRILLIHYGVDTLRVLGPTASVKNLILPHDCKGLDKLIEELSNEIHLVIHGHLHKAKLYRHGSVPVVAATTTTQRGAENGFFLLKFFASGEIATEHHVWLKTGFLRDSRVELNQVLGMAIAAR
jgi:hypothetical protein